MIPFLTDHELESILQAAKESGAQSAHYTLLRLPFELKELFSDWLETHYPQKAAHVMSRLRQMREGKENDPDFGSRMRGTGLFADLLEKRYRVALSRLGLNKRNVLLDTGRFRSLSGQMDLF